MASSKVMTSTTSTNSDLPRQSSICSLTIADLQSDQNKSFGSMSMDDLLKNIYGDTLSPETFPVVANGNSGDGVGRPTVSRQGSFSLPKTMENKTVDEVWKDIVSGSDQRRVGVAEGGMMEEMTLEDFLTKAGAVREEDVRDPVITGPGGYGVDSSIMNGGQFQHHQMQPQSVEGSIVAFGNGIEAKSNSVLSKLEEKQTSNTEKQRPLEKIPGNNDTDRSEESRSTSVVLQEDKVYLTKVNSHGSVKKIESWSSPTDVSARCMYAEEDSSPFLLPGSVTSVKSFSISSKQEENQNSNTENQGSLEKTPSNVRKMISAFESSLPQDSNSHIKPPITKSQSYQNGMESPMQNEHLKEAETENTEPLQSNSGGVVDITTVGDLQQAPVYIRKKKLLVGFYRDLDKMKSYQDNKMLKESREPHIQSKIMSSSAKNNLKVEHKEVDTREERSPEDSIKTSTIEIATVSGQVSDDNFIICNSCNLFMNQQDSVGTSVILGCEKEIHSIDSHAINIRSASHDRLQSVLCSEDEHNSFRTSGTWIFPDEAISSCITTGGKQAMDLIGGCSFEAKTHQGRISSSSEHAKEHSMSSGTDLTVNNDMNTSLKPRNPRLESAADSETSGRLVGQVIKVAIMFGFGTLVFCTRQMKNR